MYHCITKHKNGRVEHAWSEADETAARIKIRKWSYRYDTTTWWLVDDSWDTDHGFRFRGGAPD